MKNYRFIVNLSAFEVSGSIEKEKEVKDIQLQLLSDKAGMTGLCKNGVMRYCCIDYRRRHREYQDFFFQAENAIEALEMGLDHYRKQDLEKMNSMSIELMLVDDSVSYEHAKQMSESEAMARIDEYNKNRFKSLGL